MTFSLNSLSHAMMSRLCHWRSPADEELVFSKVFYAKMIAAQFCLPLILTVAAVETAVYGIFSMVTALFSNYLPGRPADPRLLKEGAWRFALNFLPSASV